MNNVTTGNGWCSRYLLMFVNYLLQLLILLCIWCCYVTFRNFCVTYLMTIVLAGNGMFFCHFFFVNDLLMFVNRLYH